MTPVRAGRGEVLVRGGLSNAGLVSRVWDTVRRPQRAMSPTIHAMSRLRVFVDAYGLPEDDRERVADVTIHTHDGSGRSHPT